MKEVEITFYAMVDDDFDLNLWWRTIEGQDPQIIKISNPSYREIKPAKAESKEKTSMFNPQHTSKDELLEATEAHNMQRGV